MKILQATRTETDMPGGVVTDTSEGGSICGVMITDNYFWGYYGVRITSDRFTDFSIINNYFVESNGGSIILLIPYVIELRAISFTAEEARGIPYISAP